MLGFLSISYSFVKNPLIYPIVDELGKLSCTRPQNISSAMPFLVGLFFTHAFLLDECAVLN